MIVGVPTPTGLSDPPRSSSPVPQGSPSRAPVPQASPPCPGGEGSYRAGPGAGGSSFLDRPSKSRKAGVRMALAGAGPGGAAVWGLPVSCTRVGIVPV